jgi:hypothetical protein
MNEPTITIAGNLTADPELRWTPTGKPVTGLRVASTPRRPVNDMSVAACCLTHDRPAAHRQREGLRRPPRTAHPRPRLTTRHVPQRVAVLAFDDDTAAGSCGRPVSHPFPGHGRTQARQPGAPLHISARAALASRRSTGSAELSAFRFG